MIIKEHISYLDRYICMYVLKVTSTTHPANDYVRVSREASRSIVPERRAETSFIKRSFRCGTIVDLIRRSLQLLTSDLRFFRPFAKSFDFNESEGLSRGESSITYETSSISMLNARVFPKFPTRITLKTKLNDVLILINTLPCSFFVRPFSPST